ncbi:MAG: TrmH family RNA methyltransferase [Acidimicrobiales bacterium]|nr:TrmH family RNA methyltransferase [Acidimicrobiales bacterium]
MRQLDGTGLKRLHRGWRQRTHGRLALLLDGVQTPVNVGSIVRTAAALRVERLWLTGTTPAPDAPGARKTALGTERYLQWTTAGSAEEAMAAARRAGFLVVALELADGAVPLHELPLPNAVCLAVGHEDHGLSAGALRAADAVAYLPQLGRVGSLNVAVAASIALYEVRRREWAGQPSDPGDPG